MSFSLALANGDLVLQGGQLSIVAGSQKLLQDLYCWTQTRMGSDIYNLGYGSLIDGGTQPNGTIVTSPIGTMSWSITQTLIQQDITRICAAYQAEQNARMQSDLQQFNKSTLTDDEILAGVNGITFNSNLDMLIVNISISNKSGSTFTIAIPIQGTVL